MPQKKLSFNYLSTDKWIAEWFAWWCKTSMRDKSFISSFWQMRIISCSNVSMRTQYALWNLSFTTPQFPMRGSFIYRIQTWWKPSSPKLFYSKWIWLLQHVYDWTKRFSCRFWDGLISQLKENYWWLNQINLATLKLRLYAYNLC